MTGKLFQDYLDASYKLICDVADFSQTPRWKTLAVEFLKNKCTITMLPWWWPKRDINAITIRPMLIWLSDAFFKQLPEWQAATLLHEAIHIQQYFNGKLTWRTYIFDKHKRLELEAEGIREEKDFIDAYRAWKKKYPGVRLT